MNSIYCGPPPFPSEIWARWNFDPPLVVALLALAILVRSSRSGLFGVFILVLAFVSPLCALSSALFSARVVHHILLVVVAAPILASAFAPSRSRPIALPFFVSTLVLWGWHTPIAYDLALSNVAVYWLMQLSLLGSAFWFWGAVLAARGSAVESLLFVVAAFGQMGLLGALLTFAPQSLYAVHAVAPFSWGLSPLEDQQLGGLIMWVPAGIPYAVVAIILARKNWSRLSGVSA